MIEFVGDDELPEAAPVYGPQLPVAYCRSCKTQLRFERTEHHVEHGAYIHTGWRCECTDCADGEAVRYGEGESPWEALDDLATMHWYCEPEELLIPKEGT